MIGDRETRVDRGSSKVQGTVTKGTYFILIQRGQGQCPKAGVGKKRIIRLHESKCYACNLRWGSDPSGKLKEKVWIRKKLK